LAAEQALFDSIRKGEQDSAAMAWQPIDRALVMPQRYQGREGFSAVSKTLRMRSWPILFRRTGGEPVPQSPQVINVALARRFRGAESLTDIQWAFRLIGDPWCIWLQEQGVLDVDLGPVPGAYCNGRFNLRVQGRKLVGTAQRWQQVCGEVDMALLVHGAMQFDGDALELVEVVNDFQAGIGSRSRFEAQQHIALREVLADFQPGTIAMLLARYQT